MLAIKQEIEITDWRGLYGDGWHGQITPASFAHPAKFARGLIRKIYSHAIEEGWLQAGDGVVDCFGGVALGALDAIRQGLHWTGVELESKFVELGNQNIKLWSEYYESRLRVCGSARLIQGDSRQLASVIEQVRCCVSSPPYIGTAVEKNSMGVNLEKQYQTYRSQGGGASFEKFCATQEKHSGGYGSSEGQLSALKEGDLQAVISSPPFAECLATNPPNKEFERKRQKQRGRNPDSPGAGADADYGTSEGQLGAMKEGSLNAVISSPPFVESLASDEPDKRGGLFRDPKRRNDKTLTATYGESEGQLGGMAAGDYQAVVSSPPFEASVNRQGEWNNSLDPQKSKYPQNRSKEYVKSNQFLYGESTGNIGNSQGDSFWQAARLIVEQVYQVLSPDAHALWVLKGFVRKGEYVDFPAQWQALCEAVGFKTIHYHRAWLVEHHGEQANMFGDVDSIETHRKSFFRRLSEKNGSPPINFEVVLCMQKFA